MIEILTRIGTFGAMVSLSACASAVPVAPEAAAPLTVMRQGAPYGNWEGAAARQQAEAECAARGAALRPSIYDRFEAGAWVFVEGCA